MQKYWTLISVLIFLIVAFWWSPEIETIAAGVAIFLFGMLFLETEVKSFTGGILEKLLRQSTNSL